MKAMRNREALSAMRKRFTKAEAKTNRMRKLAKELTHDAFCSPPVTMMEFIDKALLLARLVLRK